MAIVVSNQIGKDQRPSTNHRMEALVVQMLEVKSGRLALC
jgi:hypothetical protein